MGDIAKIQAQKEFESGKHTKAELARKYSVSPRTIGRWTEGLVAKKSATPAKQETAKKTTFPPPAPKAAKSYTDVALASIGSPAATPAPETLSRRIVEAPATKPVAAQEVEYSVVATPRSIAITKTVDGKVEGTMSSNKDGPLFNEILTALKTHGVFDQVVLADCYLKLKPAEAIRVLSSGALTVDVSNNTIDYKTASGVVVKVDNSLSRHIIDALRKDGKLTDAVQKLLKFLENLMLNPSYRAVNELYGFLKATDIELTDDGHFMAWKKVGPTYMDIHSNTMLNKPGTEVRVPRNMVDEDSSRTCSHGLHVCSKSYLGQFGSASGNRVVRVKVNPADVVAIPKDYNNTKMRCAGYFVVDDVTNTNLWK
jgi:hypothetical protein